MKSIQTKFIILILGCVLASSLVIGIAGIVKSEKVIDKDSAQIMNLMCSEKSKELDATLSKIEQSVKTLAVYALDNLESLDRLKNDVTYVQDYTNNLQSVAVNAAENTEGAMAVYIRYNPEFTPPTSGLFWSKTELNGRFQQLEPTDFSSYSPDDSEHVGWYYIPVKSGKATWLEPYVNQNINVLMISYVIPLYSENEIVGIVGMDIDFGLITHSVASIKAYDDGYAFLANDDGEVLYHSFYPLGASMESVSSDLTPVVNELKNGTSGSYLFTYNLDGIEKQMAFRSLINGMRLAITAPASQIDAAKDQLVEQIIISVIIISVFSILLTVLLTRKIIRPLKQLKYAAQKIADGDLSISLDTQTKDEIGELSDSFQKTVNSLQQYMEYINGLAYRDSLTGVKNKTAYQEVVQNMEEKMRLSNPQFAVVEFDMNNLKWINDNCGHDFGDILIIECCKLICSTFKHSPVFRIGGDEFVTILENADFASYNQLMEDFENAIVEHNKACMQSNKISIARGIAIYNSQTDLVFANVFKRADDAMYQNKLAMKEKSTDVSREDNKNS